MIMMLHAHHDILLLLGLLLLMELLLMSLVLLPHDTQGFLLSYALSVPEHSICCSIPCLLLSCSIGHLHGGLLCSVAGGGPVAHRLPHGKGVGEVLTRLEVDRIPPPCAYKGTDVVHGVHRGAGVVLVLRRLRGGKVSGHRLLMDKTSLLPPTAACG